MDPEERNRFDHHMMGIALRMARRGIGTTAPNPSVGAVIANEASGVVIARAVTAPGGRPHAEPLAIASAGELARGATMYVTLEPCSHHGRTPPCSGSIIEAQLARVVVALTDPDPRVSGRGLTQLRQAGIDVARGIRAAEAHWLTRGHIVRITERRPFVQLKLALGADGAVPRGAGGAAVFVTQDDARAHGHLLRAEADAILVGHGTVRDDDPDLTCRLPGLRDRSPVRVIVASQIGGLTRSRLAESARAVPVHVFTTAETMRTSASEVAQLTQQGVTVDGVRSVSGSIWLPAVLERLAELGVTRLLVEGGPTVWRAFADHGLYDEVVLFQARDAGVAMVDEAAAREALARVAGLRRVTLTDHRRFSNDDVLVFRSGAINAKDLVQHAAVRPRDED